MPFLEQISTNNILAFKTVRLQALQDSPAAFGSTYARESQFLDAEWLKRAANMNGEKGIGYLAVDDESPCGIVGAFANVVSMWVAPAHRRTGVGSFLISAVQTWTRTCGVRTLRLMVTSNNSAAIEFYKRMGYSMTGNTEPYPNDSTVIEYELSQLVPTADR
jgi:GNAT superfamily N-acetyltransferase